MSKPQIRVLLVEDDLVDRMACRRALAKHPDYEFVLFEAETGREGLQLAHLHHPDCVVLDYNLPDLNGLEFLSELKNEQGEMPVSVMMLTGAGNVLIAVEAMRHGAQDYLVKDVNRQYLELLPTVIQRVLRERRALTGKKQAEEQLIQAEAKYRLLVEQIPAITYTTALHEPDKLLYISPQIRQLGYSSEEWLADPEGLFKQIHPEDRTRVRAQIERCYESGELLRCEYRMFTSDGKIRWFLNEASMVYDASGEPLFMQGVLLDITEEKIVEEELLQHRSRLGDLVAVRTAQFEKKTAILESANTNLTAKLEECKQIGKAQMKHVDQLADLYHNAPCGYFSLDPDGMFVQINDTGLKWLGRTREEVVGKMKFSDLLTPANSKTFLGNFQHFKESGWVHDLRLEIVHMDGTSLHVLLNANAIKDNAGRFVMSRSMMIDITDNKRDG